MSLYKRKECYVKMKAEIGAIDSSRQKLGERHGRNSSSQLSEETNPANILIPASSLED